MSDAQVRLAIQEFFQTPAIDGIQRVFRDVPWFMDGAQWDVFDNRGWAAVASVHLDRSEETRITLPWKDGSKQVDHNVGLIIQYQYLIPATFGQDEYEDAWVDGLDAIVDAVKERIRSDYTFNNPNVIFQGGQTPNDIRIQRDVPIIDKGRVVSWNVIQFSVTEILQA
jgi:hypothetical protein